MLDSYDALAIDLDGVVWRGTTILEGALEALRHFRDVGLGILLLTNNGEYAPEVIVKRLDEAGIKVGVGEVMNSVDAALELIEWLGLTGSDTWIVGPAPIAEQVSGKLTVLPVGKGTPEIVIVGRDRSFDYPMLTRVADVVRGGAKLVALNRDPAIPVESGFEPGTGALVAAIESASGVIAAVAGKPSLSMMRAAAERLGEGRILMIGDSLHSDIAGAAAMGWDSVLIAADAPKPSEDGDPRPTYVVESLGGVPGIEPLS